MFNWFNEEENNDNEVREEPEAEQKPETDVDDLFGGDEEDEGGDGSAVKEYNVTVTIRIVDFVSWEAANNCVEGKRDAEGTLIVKTTDAILVQFDTEKVWLPISQLEWVGELREDRIVYIPEWLASENNI